MTQSNRMQYLQATTKNTRALTDMDLAARLLLMKTDPTVPSAHEKDAWLTEAAMRLSRAYWQANATGNARSVTVEGEREEAPGKDWEGVGV